MRKLMLDPETLLVESFETERNDFARGTVVAQQFSYPAGVTGCTNCTVCAEATCGAECDTDARTCGGLCWGTSECQDTRYPRCIS
jgi:hypothetical protein